MDDFVMNEKRSLNYIASGDNNKYSAVICQKIVSAEEKLQRLQIVTLEYSRRKYITTQDLKAVKHYRVYVDRYDDVAHAFVAKIGSEVVASLRLIPNEKLGLPMYTELEVQEKIFPQFKDVVKYTKYEWSQLAKSRSVSE